MRAFIKERLEAIFRRPNTWGPPRAVELQVLLLVEMWHVAGSRNSLVVNMTSDRYSKYLGKTLGGSPLDLTGRLGLNNEATDEFVTILKGFVIGEIGL